MNKIDVMVDRFGLNMLALRHKKNLTIRYCANKVNVNTGTYANYERGDSKPTLVIALKICDLFQTDIKTMLETDILDIGGIRDEF